MRGSRRGGCCRRRRGGPVRLRLVLETPAERGGGAGTRRGPGPGGAGTRVSTRDGDAFRSLDHDHAQTGEDGLACPARGETTVGRPQSGDRFRYRVVGVRSSSRSRHETHLKTVHVIRGTGAIPRRSRRGYAPSLLESLTSQTPVLSFPQERLIDRLLYGGVGIGRNGADSVPSDRGGLSRPQQ
jgi:hypothetical protein